MPALAAELRAFSSLLSLPSPAQSVIKAFRRQGNGFADVFNIARFLLYRIESLSASAPSLPNLPRAVKIGRYRAQWARQCDLFRSASAALHKSHRLALMPASALLPLYCLVEVCARAGETVNLPLEPQCVRLLPRPHGLASSRFQKVFVTCCARAKNLLPPSRSRGLTDASASVVPTLSRPALMKQWCIIYMVINQQLKSWSASYVLKTYYRY